jgi:hypothetical protein
MSVHNICRHFTNPYIDGMPDVLVVPDPGPGQIPHIAIQVLDAKPDKKRKKKNTIPKRAHEVLSALKRVERVEVKLGNQVKTWYLNLPGNLNELFCHIGMPYLFEEPVRIEI